MRTRAPACFSKLPSSGHLHAQPQPQRSSAATRSSCFHSNISRQHALRSQALPHHQYTSADGHCMQRRVLMTMAAQALREIRARGSLAQEPAAFRALHAHGGAFSGAQDASQPKAGNDASGKRWCAVAESPDRDRPWHADGTPAIPPESDAAPREPEARLGLMFTCNKCDTRAMRTFSKAAYQGGVVIVKCGNDECVSRHLIADHLGWFGAKGRTVEDMMQDKGQEVRWQGNGDTLELSAADAAAWAKAAADTQAGREEKQAVKSLPR